MHWLGSLLLAAWLTLWGGGALAAPEVVGEEVTYSAGGVTLRGYLAVDRAREGKRPGVLVVHEWWGHNPYARHRAEMLAELGYVALAVDMYGDGRVAGHPDEARAFARAISQDFDAARGRFEAAMGLLRDHPEVSGEQLAAIGYCFGGGMVLNLARQGVDLKGVASFHGGLDPIRPARPGAIKARILVAHGEDDRMIPPAKVEAFKREMAEAGAELTFLSYPGARHAFTNPEADELARRFDLSIAYHPEADRHSWEALVTFLKGLFPAP